MLTFVLFGVGLLFASAHGGLFDPTRCSDGYEDISSVLLRFDKSQQAMQSHFPFLRGPQMRCVGPYCKRKLHAAVCFAEQTPKKRHEAYNFDCQPLGLPVGYELISYELDCEAEIPRSIDGYNNCAYKGSCILEYELAPTDLAVKSNVMLLSFLFVFALLTTMTIYFCVRFLNRFFPQHNYRRPPPYDPYENFHAYYKEGNVLDAKKVTQLH